jgi:hypothetical protein
VKKLHVRDSGARGSYVLLIGSSFGLGLRLAPQAPVLRRVTGRPNKRNHYSGFRLVRSDHAE